MHLDYSNSIANRLLFDIGDQELTQNFNSLNSQHSFVTAGSTKVTTSSFSGRPQSRPASRPSSRLGNPHRAPAAASHLSRSNSSGSNHELPYAANNRAMTIATTVSSEDIDSILDSTPGYRSSENINPINFADESQMLETFEQMTMPFEGKETEHNWVKREKCIVQLRSILRGNAVTDYPQSLAQSIKMIKEGICKAVSSLQKPCPIKMQIVVSLD
ncbi:unnamed protein product [Ambrosiozyma monospora]|uniref:Unnamed protein product n=1 Tax=Ambrosiozyma monospora TaxID=43982 RepID=A0ACB5U770_AMBMO|nr:unnamed protein product [Ambrosiozyma monospora]